MALLVCLALEGRYGVYSFRGINFEEECKKKNFQKKARRSSFMDRLERTDCWRIGEYYNAQHKQLYFFRNI